MKKETKSLTKADLDALKQAIGKVTPKAATTGKSARLRSVTYTR